MDAWLARVDRSRGVDHGPRSHWVTSKSLCVGVAHPHAPAGRHGHGEPSKIRHGGLGVGDQGFF